MIEVMSMLNTALSMLITGLGIILVVMGLIGSVIYLTGFIKDSITMKTNSIIIDNNDNR